MIQIILSFVITSSILALTPGPDNIFVLTQSLVNGKKYGFATVLGLATGCLVHTSLVAFGVSVIIKENEPLFFTIKLFGALYLLYLAYLVFKSNDTILLSEKKLKKKTLLQLYKQGFFMNVLNPKVSLFFLAFFPAFLYSKSINPIVQFYVLGGLFILVTIIVFGLIVFLAGGISKKIKSNSKIGWYLRWIQLLIFIFIAGLILI